MLAIARGWTEGVKLLAAVDQVDLGSAEHFARYNSTVKPDIIRVLVEAKQRRREKRERLVREQRREVSKVLLVRGDICHSRHCRRQCKIFARVV